MARGDKSGVSLTLETVVRRKGRIDPLACMIKLPSRIRFLLDLCDGRAQVARRVADARAE